MGAFTIATTSGNTRFNVSRREVLVNVDQLAQIARELGLSVEDVVFMATLHEVGHARDPAIWGFASMKPLEKFQAELRAWEYAINTCVENGLVPDAVLAKVYSARISEAEKRLGKGGSMDAPKSGGLLNKVAELVSTTRKVEQVSGRLYEQPRKVQTFVLGDKGMRPASDVPRNVTEVHGLLKQIVDFNIVLDFPDPVRHDPKTVSKWQSDVLAQCERAGIWLLPVEPGTFLDQGAEWHFVPGIYRSTTDMVTDINERVMAAFGVRLHEKAMREVGKSFAYMGSPLIPGIHWTGRFDVFPIQAFKDKSCLDGMAVYLPRRNAETIGTVDYKGKAVDIALDGQILQVRGLTKAGNLIKGTLQPTTRKWLKDNVNPDYLDCVVTALKRGRIVSTADTVKYADVGLHIAELWLHHSSSLQKPMFCKGKILVEQLYRKMNFSHTDGLEKVIDKNVGDFARTIAEGPQAVARMLLNNKSAWDDGSKPVASYVSTFQQVEAGRQYGLHFSDRVNFAGALPKVLKKTSEIRGGTKNFKKFSFGEHTGIYLYGYLHGDAGLGRKEISLPAKLFDQVMEALGKAGLTVDKTCTIIRRFPITVTSAQKVILVRRDDNHKFLGCGRWLAQQLGADFDGDHGAVTITPSSLFDVKEQSGDTMKVEPNDRIAQHAVYNMPTRKVERVGTLGDDIPSILYELVQSGAIGLVDWSILKLANHLAKQGSAEPRLRKFLFAMEVGIFSGDRLQKPGILQAIIGGKKGMPSEVPDLATFSDLLRDERTDRYGRFYPGLKPMPAGLDVVRAKVAMGNIQNLAEVLEEATEDRPDPFFRVHNLYLDAVGKVLPAIKVGLNSFEFNYDRAKTVKGKAMDLAKRLVIGNGHLLGDKFGFRFGEVILGSGARIQTFSNDMLEDWRSMMADKRPHSVLNAVKAAIVEEVVGRTSTPEERVRVGMLLLCVASCNVTRACGTFAWVYDYVDPFVAKIFHELMEDEDGTRYLIDRMGEIRRVNLRNRVDQMSRKLAQMVNSAEGSPVVDITDVEISAVSVYSTTGDIPEGVRQMLDTDGAPVRLVDKIDENVQVVIVGNPDIPRDLYQQIATAGSEIAVFRPRKSGKWYVNTVGR